MLRMERAVERGGHGGPLDVMRSTSPSPPPERIAPHPRGHTGGARVTLASCAALLALLAPPARAQSAGAAPHAVTAFVSVNVIPMDSDRVLRGQTVLVKDGRVAAIGASLRVPADARVIDGHGTAYLSPGLADMHTHVDTKDALKVYLANGVTTVLNMGNASSEFIARTRPAANTGKIPGPHVYAAFLVDGSPRYGHFMVTTPDEARAVVRLARTNGYDFIKVYNDLSPECFLALIEEGRREHVKIVGHGVTRVGIRRQLDAGQILVAHTEEYLYTVFARRDDPPTDAAPDPARIPGAIAFTKRDGAFVTADLNTFATIARQWGRPDVVARYGRMPEIRWLAPAWRLEWRKSDYASRRGSLDARLAFLARFTKAMSDAGVHLVAGTDAPTIPGLVPGVSLHDDLRELERAGLDRYRVLATATREPGELIRRSVPGAEPFGTVTPGSRADLLLTAGNPLDDLSTLRAPLGVMANGKWYTAADLRALLDQVARDYDESCATR